MHTGSTLTENVSVVLADPPYNTRSSRSQPNSGQDVISKEDIGDAMKLMSEVMAPGERGHTFCLSLMFYHLNGSLQVAMEYVEK